MNLLCYNKSVWLQRGLIRVRLYAADHHIGGNLSGLYVNAGDSGICYITKLSDIEREF